MELMAYLLADLWSKPRLLVPLLLGVVAGLGLFHLTGKAPSSAAMAFGCALLGLAIGDEPGLLLDRHELDRAAPRGEAAFRVV